MKAYNTYMEFDQPLIDVALMFLQRLRRWTCKISAALKSLEDLVSLDE